MRMIDFFTKPSIKIELIVLRRFGNGNVQSQESVDKVDIHPSVVASMKLNRLLFISNHIRHLL